MLQPAPAATGFATTRGLAGGRFGLLHAAAYGRLAEGLVFGYLRMYFAFTDRPTITVYIGVLAKKESDSWFLDHYQVSKLD